MPRVAFRDLNFASFAINDTVKVSEDIVQGKRYGSITCSQRVFDLRGKDVIIKEVLMHNNYPYYRIYSPSTLTASDYIHESMFVLPPIQTISIDVISVIQAYKVTELVPTRGRFFKSNNYADAFGALSVAMGGRFNDSDDLVRYMTKLYDIKYLIGFAYGFDQRLLGSNNQTEIMQKGYADGLACSSAVYTLFEEVGVL